jgi:DNA repair exonuclease SbcCD ATPase subunit
MTVKEAKAELSRAQGEVETWRARQAELLNTIEELTALARQGKSDRAGELAHVANAKAEADRSLEDAEDALETATQKLADAEAEADRNRFTVVIDDLKKSRREFTELLRRGCLLLGKIVDLKAEAVQLSRSQLSVTGPATDPMFYRSPSTQQALKEVVNVRLPAASDFCEGMDGLAANAGSGWNVQATIVPLHKSQGGEKYHG